MTRSKTAKTGKIIKIAEYDSADDVIAFYKPHSRHGRDRDARPVVVEDPVDLARLMTKTGLTGKILKPKGQLADTGTRTTAKASPGAELLGEVEVAPRIPETPFTTDHRALAVVADVHEGAEVSIIVHNTKSTSTVRMPTDAVRAEDRKLLRPGTELWVLYGHDDTHARAVRIVARRHDAPDGAQLIGSDGTPIATPLGRDVWQEVSRDWN